jgi:hypothetical protein
MAAEVGQALRTYSLKNLLSNVTSSYAAYPIRLLQMEDT